jgi:hypothetical protein
MTELCCYTYPPPVEMATSTGVDLQAFLRLSVLQKAMHQSHVAQLPAATCTTHPWRSLLAQVSIQGPGMALAASCCACWACCCCCCRCAPLQVARPQVSLQGVVQVIVSACWMLTLMLWSLFKENARAVLPKRGLRRLHAGDRQCIAWLRPRTAVLLTMTTFAVLHKNFDRTLRENVDRTLLCQSRRERSFASSQASGVSARRDAGCTMSSWM